MKLTKPEDLFIQLLDGTIIERPLNINYKPSQCTPLFMNAYLLRNSGAVIHTHSKKCVMVTLLYPGTEFRITHQEMIKGIKKCKSGVAYRYDEELVVPIIENTPFEEDLKVILTIRLYTAYLFRINSINECVEIYTYFFFTTYYKRREWQKRWKTIRNRVQCSWDVTASMFGAPRGSRPNPCANATTICATLRLKWKNAAWIRAISRFCQKMLTSNMIYIIIHFNYHH